MATWRTRGRWRYEFTRNGKRIQGWWYATKTEAKAAEAEARRKFKTRPVINTSFLALCNARLDDLTRRSPDHFDRNRRLLKKLNRRWENKKTVTRSDVEGYLAGNAAKSNSLANRHLRLIRALFRHGVEIGIWAEDPTKGIKPYPATQAKRYVPPVEDIRKVVEAASPRQRIYLTVLIHTMGRVNAINTLKWEDVYDDHLILRTRKARNSDEKQIRVPLNDTLHATLAAIPRTSEYVFANVKTGQPYKCRLKMIHHLCDKAGVKHFTFHAFRHFGASHLIKQGVPLTDVQQLLGHEKATTTAIYLRALGDGVKDAVKKLEGI